MNTSTVRCAFTLIELLVVLTIIGLLAALLFPVFARVREQSRRTVCLSNERQIGTALLEYAQEDGGLIPGGSQPLPAPKANETFLPTGEGWAGQVYPYLRSTGVFQCPDDATVALSYNPCGLGGPDMCHPVPNAARFVVSYGMNSELLRSQTVQGRLANLPLPTKTVLLFEVSNDLASITYLDEATVGLDDHSIQTCSAGGDGSFVLASGNGNTTNFDPNPVLGGAIYATGWLGGWNPLAEYRTHQPPDAPTFYGNQAGRHSGGSNFLLADGHVKWLLPEYVLPNVRVNNPIKSQSEFDGFAASFMEQYNALGK